MARLGVSKQKKSPRATELSQLKQELKRVNEQLKSCQRELAQGIERETATGEILRVIASSPTDLQPVLDAVAENAARLCDSNDAQLRLIDGNILCLVASYGSLPTPEIKTVTRQNVTGRAVIDRQMIHIHDLEIERESEYPDSERAAGGRTVLAIPLLREGTAIGAILIRRLEVRPFTDKQISLLKTFADQAVIAIENARLLQERETRNRDLAALHDVTAAASQSLEIKPVLDEVVKKITEIFAFDSVSIYLFDPQREYLNSVASFGVQEEALHPGAFHRGQGLTGRVAETGEPIIFENVQTDPRYQELSQTKVVQQRDYCFFAIFPIKSKQRFLGTINCIGKQPRQLIAEEIRLIRSMCDQIGIAVENINLFEEVRNKTAELESSNSELREALEHQTATAEVLGIISRSPTDVQPVLDAIAQSAARVCGIDDVVLRLREGNAVIPRAHFGPIPVGGVRSIDLPHYRWIREHGTLHIPDVRAQSDFPTVGSGGGVRTFLIVPLRQHGELIGNLNARRTEVRPFTPVQIKLLETFADQAVIAIENVRLFQELEARNRDLTEALQQQTATSKILEVIASSPTDFQPVLRAIAESATRLCEATDAHMSHVDGDVLRLNADTDDASLQREVPITRDRIAGQAILDRRTIHIHDLAAEPEEKYEAHRWRSLGFRTVLMAPLLREGTAIGTLAIRFINDPATTEKQIALLE